MDYCNLIYGSWYLQIIVIGYFKCRDRKQVNTERTEDLTYIINGYYSLNSS